MKEATHRTLIASYANRVGKLLLVALLFCPIALAHNKVVVVPLGGEEAPEVRAGSEIFTNSIGMKFSLIPSGSFVMGSPDGTGSTTSRPVNSAEAGRSNLERQHYVTISKAFYMQTTEVTQAQYEAVMGSNPSHFSVAGIGVDCGPNCPVENVSWNDAQNFIDALNARENRSNCNTQPNTCYTLPSESQWEYAARGATVSAFYNGDVSNLGSGLDENLELIGWYFNNSGSSTHPVAQKAANHWGLYDMLGNVSEWCQDWQGIYPDGPSVDPAGAASASLRVYRGGDWREFARFARSARRSGQSPGNAFNVIGFRLALSLGL